MKQPRTKIASTIAHASMKNGNSKSYSQQIAAYLLSERRTGELGSLMRDVQADWAKSGYVEIIANSAHKLSESIKADITSQIKQLYPDAKQIVITEVFKPDIIGGVRLNLADQQLDLSIETKLNRFKQLTTTGKD
jgi:F0F1-type ATP synthase delta subunit